jgi:hypothetical protein
MATLIGNLGTVKVSTNTVAEVTEFSITQAATTADDTVLGDTWKSHKVGTTEWSGSVSCYWDDSDTTGQGAMTVGASVELHLIPEGAGTGNKDYNGTVTITSIEQSVTLDSIVTASFSFTGNGALTISTLA